MIEIFKQDVSDLCGAPPSLIITLDISYNIHINYQQAPDSWRPSIWAASRPYWTRASSPTGPRYNRPNTCALGPAPLSNNNPCPCVHTFIQLAGASAGSLVAASTILGLSPEEQLEAYKKMAHACRASGGFAGRVEPVLARSLQERFPKDAHEICHGRSV